MYVLDTNVVSEFRKLPMGRADVRVAQWVSKTDASLMYLSVITIMEIEIGVLRVERHDKVQATLVRSWLESKVLLAFADRILTVDVATARYAAKLHVPNPHPKADALIAATAAVYGFVIVTRNVADFAGTGVRVFNPWID